MTREHLSRSLRAEMDELVKELRPLRFAPFHVDAVARRLGIAVGERQLGTELLGLTLDSKRVLLNRRHLAGASRAFTFAHEVAHVMERRGSPTSHKAGVSGSLTFSRGNSWFRGAG